MNKSFNYEKMEVEQYLIFLQNSNTVHTLKTCKSSTSITVCKKTYFFPNSEELVESKYLSFIKAVKKEVIFNAEKLNLKDVYPRYIKFSPIFSGNFFADDFCEIDISSAYWFTAFDYGIICEETYLSGLKVPKKVRLMALGSAAVKKEVFEYNGERYIFSGFECNDFGRKAFFNIAKRVDDIMYNSLEILNGSAAFYWVDAIFVKEKFSEFVIKSIEGIGYECKKIKLAWLKGDSENKTVTACKITEQNEIFCGFELKTYYKPRKKVLKV